MTAVSRTTSTPRLEVEAFTLRMTSPEPVLVSASDAARMLCTKPWPVVRLIEAGELNAAKVDDPSTGHWHWAVSVESIRTYARKVTA